MVLRNTRRTGTSRRFIFGAVIFVAVGGLAVFKYIYFMESAISSKFVRKKQDKMISHAPAPSLPVDGQAMTPTTTEQNSKPLLLMHLGPAKTGSTTLQYYFRKDKNLFKNDGYVLERGISRITNDKECFHREKCPTENIREQEEWKQFIRTLREGSNMIVSNEVFARRFADEPAHWELLLHAVSDFHVKSVWVYRRFVEWLPSFYYQQVRGSMKKLGKNGWDWKSETFTEFFERKEHEWPIHPAEKEIIKWQKYFPDVALFNMHDNTDNFVADFYCKMIPNTANACTYRTDEGLEKQALNVGHPLQYQFLALAAHSEGLVKNTTSILDVIAAAKKRQEVDLNLTANDFPHECLSVEQEESLLNRSLQFEKHLLPEWFESPRGEVEHRAKYAVALQKRKFCSVEAFEVLKDEDWRNFFLSLKI